MFRLVVSVLHKLSLIAAVIFLDDIIKVNRLVVINDTFVPVMLLAVPAKRVIITSIPLLISDEVLLRELSKHRKMMSLISRSSGCISPLLKHVVSPRLQVYMILSEKD